MAELEYHNAWHKSDPELMGDARAFWEELGQVPEEEIEERLPQLCAIAYDSGKVVGVSTAYPYIYPRLRSRFAYYRTAIDPNYRRKRVAASLCSFSWRVIGDWAKEHPEEELQGLFIILQAKEFKSRQRNPMVHLLGITYSLVGYTPSGYQMRVVWFENADVE